MLTTFASCRVVSIDEDRTIRARASGTLDAPNYVAQLWQSRALPELQRRAQPARILIPAIASGIDAAGSRLGRKVGEGAAWTFVTAAGARVLTVDRTSRHGTATVALDDVSPARTAVIQIGPVVSGAVIRDALPFIAFNDFSDQMVFADVARALTSRATAGAAVARQLQPGERIRFAGVFDLRRADGPIVITPYQMSVASGIGG